MIFHLTDLIRKGKVVAGWGTSAGRPTTLNTIDQTARRAERLRPIRMLMMRAVIAVAVLTFSNSTIAELGDCAAAARLSGLWATEIQGDGYYVYGEFHYRDDGQSFGRGVRIVNGEQQRIAFTGTWRIEGHQLVFSTEQSNDASWFPHPRTYRDRIETLTDHKLVLVAETGERSVRYRLAYSRLFPQ